MIQTKIINELIGVDDSYKAPDKLLKIMLNKTKREELFQLFLKEESDFSYEWFMNYFEEEQSQRKLKKQDFTPLSISKLLATISGQSDTYFECAAGTGSILIQSWNINKDIARYYVVEELSDRAIPFLLFNMSIRKLNGIVLHGDSLTGEEKHIYKLDNGEIEEQSIGCQYYKESKIVLMNPPYSAPWSPKKDERFKDYGLAPKSKADMAFVLHGLYNLKSDGVMAVVLPHGVLFRGNAEGKIRQKILENNLLKAVIGLPEKLFLNTSIPTVVLVFKKNSENSDVLFIDASKEFEKGKNQNFLSDDHISKIAETYRKQQNIDKYSKLVGYEEIIENDFNLNIPRYVDTFEPDPTIPLTQIIDELNEIDALIQESECELKKMINELVGTTKESQKELSYFQQRFKNRR